MAIQTFTGFIEDPPAPNQVSALPTFGTTQLLIDAAGEKAATVIFDCPETCSIRKVGFATRTVTTGATLDVRLEEHSDTDGFPTGSLAGANTNASQVVLSTDDSGYFIPQLTADASVTAGQKLALVLVNPAGSPGNMQIGCFGDEQAHTPYAALFTTVWSGVSGMRPMGYFEKSDGSALYVPGVTPMSGTASTTFNNSTNPNHRALRSRRPYTARVCGFWIWGDIDGDFRMLFVEEDWDGTDGDALAYRNVDKDIRSTAAAGIHFYMFPSTQRPTIAANLWTRLVIKPTTATSLTALDMLVANSTVMGAAPGGVDYHLSTANDPNDNTDWTNTLITRPYIGLLLDGFDDGAGGGGGVAGYSRSRVVNR